MKKVPEKASILVLDDEERQRGILSLILEDAGYEVLALGSANEALEIVKKNNFDLILTDLMMPEMNGIQFLEAVRLYWPEQVIVVVTAHGSIQSAVEAMKKGAFNYMTKPLQKEELLVIVERALEQARLLRENKLLYSQLKQHYSLENMVGQHRKMHEVFRLAEKVARSNTTVLIYGESGTGKELVARAIHQHSLRSSLPMQAINCAAIPENLLESELFGYERGAFTGAYARKKGLVEQASGSTLFLDEIGDLGLPLQGKILRVLQEQEIQRLGGNVTIQVDVRVISATHRDLKKMMAEGKFREDLYYRLNTFPIVIPPLRERDTDVPLLVNHFLRKFQALGKGRVKRVSPDAMRRLLSFRWPGNVRELESAIERAIILAESEVIGEEDLAPEIVHPLGNESSHGGMDLPKILEKTESAGSELATEDNLLSLDENMSRQIRQALQVSGGRISGPRGAAQLLGINPNTLRGRMRKLGIPFKRS
jgi:DNA-binding NtrC family response regulator